MAWFLGFLAEAWRWRWRIGFPMLLGLAWGAMQVFVYPEIFEAKALLQLQSEQAREPLLQKITARGHKDALYQKLIDPQVLADSGKEAGVEIRPQQVNLVIFNDHFLGITYRSSERRNIEQVVDSLAFNFIQQVLSPERARIEQMLNMAKEELVNVVIQINDLESIGRGAGAEAAPAGAEGSPDGGRSGAMAELLLKRRQLENDIVQLQTDLRLVNTAFDRGGSQALMWFAQPAVLVTPTPWALRLIGWMLWGGFAGFAAGWLVFRLPQRWRETVDSPREVAKAGGLSVAGTLPWLGKVKTNHSGAHVTAQGRVLRPSGFAEVGRMQATLLRNVRGPLVLVGTQGLEGVSTAALLLAEKAASLGKSVILADMNLKNRGLSHALGVRGEAWLMPKKGKAKGEWSALQPLTGVENLKVLPAPKNPETLAALAEQGGVAHLMEQLCELADIVIVDASPVAAINRGNIDAVTVAGSGGRVVLVAQAGVTSPADLRHAADTLLLSGASLSGVLLNQQYMPSRRQMLSDLANWLGPLGNVLRQAAIKARVE